MYSWKRHIVNPPPSPPPGAHLCDPPPPPTPPLPPPTQPQEEMWASMTAASPSTEKSRDCCLTGCQPFSLTAEQLPPIPFLTPIYSVHGCPLYMKHPYLLWYPLSSRELGESGRNTPPRKRKKEGTKAKPRESLQPHSVAPVTLIIRLMTCTFANLKF